MAEIILVKHDQVDLSAAERDIVNRVLFGVVDGLGHRHKKDWRRCWNWFLAAEPGETFVIKTERERSGPFHRRHMKIEHDLFESQERFDHWEGFRIWLKVGAGWVDWAAGPKGGVVPVPRSTSYAAAEEDEFRRFHDLCIQFLRGPHAAPYLWPHLGAEGAHDFMHNFLSRFDE